MVHVFGSLWRIGSGSGTGLGLGLALWLCAWTWISNGTLAQNVISTGATFPASVYRESVFAYRFVETEQTVTYVPTGSSTGKCNIMGYWSTGNTGDDTLSFEYLREEREACSNGEGASERSPLVDFVGSDSILSDANYDNFPDLQMFPALAGAVVPIYNIPECEQHPSCSLVLSRSTLADIFDGKIRYWNDSRIVADNTADTAALLSTITEVIQPVVRSDGSGTTHIFTDGLSSFDPPADLADLVDGVADYSFATVVTGDDKPFWCGPLTDEIFTITVSGCDPAGAYEDKLVTLMVYGPDSVLRPLAFECDIEESSFQTLYKAANNNQTVHVKRSLDGIDDTDTSTPLSTFTYTVGLLASTDDADGNPQNWHQPSIVHTASALSVDIATFQEGGFLNTHYRLIDSLLETRSIFVMQGAENFRFNLSYGGEYAGSFDSKSANLSSDIADALAGMMMNFTMTMSEVGIVGKGDSPNANYTVYRLVYAAVDSDGDGDDNERNTVPELTRHVDGDDDASAVLISTLTTANNYPLYRDESVAFGFGDSGKFSCFARHLNYEEWSYYAGAGNPGVIAEVMSIPYSVGYSVLEQALRNGIATASLINRAGNVVAPTAETVAYQVLEKGHNLDARLNANLVDGSSDNVWPLVGYTYFVIRRNHHLGTCEHRQAVMQYLHNFYYSDVVKDIASRLGFAVLPSFVRDIVVDQLVEETFCEDGSYALASFRRPSSLFLTSPVMTGVLETYLSVYGTVSPEVDFQLSDLHNSENIWNMFMADPEMYAGAFTMFGDATEKIEKYMSNPEGSVITSSFLHFSVAVIYHLDALDAAGARLHFTADILGSILAGEITYWDDDLIKAANAGHTEFLPHERIHVVAMPDASDTNKVLCRYLTLNSEAFRATYPNASDSGCSYIDFASVLEDEYATYEENSGLSDNSVTHFHGSIGYYNMMYSIPNSPVAEFYHDDTFLDGVFIDGVYPVDGGEALNACQQDSATFVRPSPYVSTFDLMLSASPACYPIAGTIDFSTYAAPNAESCAVSTTGDTSSEQPAYDRVAFGSWLFNGDVITGPLGFYNAYPSTQEHREIAFNGLCDIQCDNTALGYEVCGYRDCTYADGDFVRVIEPCDASTQTREVQYELTAGNGCKRNSPDDEPAASTEIECTFVMVDSEPGQGAFWVAILGIALIVYTMVQTIRFRKENILQRSQPAFLYLFLIGAACMCASVFVLLGPNTDRSCLARPWIVCITTTLMFAPLLMKLRRVDRLFNDQAKRQVRITEAEVFQQVAALIYIDIIILTLWTIINRPRSLVVQSSNYPGLLEPVDDVICSTGIGDPFEIVMVGYKSILLLAGIYLSLKMWSISSEFSEAKAFALAIYNIGIIGGLSYFLSVLLVESVGVVLAVTLKCFGMVLCAVVSTVLVMFPKLIVIFQQRAERKMKARAEQIDKQRHHLYYPDEEDCLHANAKRNQVQPVNDGPTDLNQRRDALRVHVESVEGGEKEPVGELNDRSLHPQYSTPNPLPPPKRRQNLYDVTFDGLTKLKDVRAVIEGFASQFSEREDQRGEEVLNDSYVNPKRARLPVSTNSSGLMDIPAHWINRSKNPFGRRSRNSSGSQGPRFGVPDSDSELPSYFAGVTYVTEGRRSRGAYKAQPVDCIGECDDSGRETIGAPSNPHPNPHLFPSPTPEDGLKAAGESSDMPRPMMDQNQSVNDGNVDGHALRNEIGHNFALTTVEEEGHRTDSSSGAPRHAQSLTARGSNDSAHLSHSNEKTGYMTNSSAGSRKLTPSGTGVTASTGSTSGENTGATGSNASFEKRRRLRAAGGSGLAVGDRLGLGASISTGAAHAQCEEGMREESKSEEMRAQ